MKTPEPKSGNQKTEWSVRTQTMDMETINRKYDYCAAR